MGMIHTRLVLVALALMPVAACRHRAPACNAIVNQAPAVPFTRGGRAPLLGGGAIADGLYDATRAEGFGDAPAAGRRMTLEVRNLGTRFAWAGDILDAAGANVTLSLRANANVTASGTWLALATTCSSLSPSPLPATMVFAASPNMLVLASRDEQGAVTSVTTYARRP